MCFFLLPNDCIRYDADNGSAGIYRQGLRHKSLIFYISDLCVGRKCFQDFSICTQSR